MRIDKIIGLIKPMKSNSKTALICAQKRETTAFKLLPHNALNDYFTIFDSIFKNITIFVNKFNEYFTKILYFCHFALYNRIRQTK